MRISSPAVLEAIFAFKGNFAEGNPPQPKVVDGVEVALFKNNAPAAACISADFEMGWGWRSRGAQGATAMGDLERRHVPLILGLLEEYSIPITWATIGHLFLESCSRASNGLAHPTMPRPLSDGTWSGDWYWPDPCSNVRDAPAWYAPDLIHQITDSKVGHELGTHSFSHINFQAPYSSPEVVQAELEHSIDVMRPFGVRPRTLIFPRHQSEPAYLPLLASAGISVVRHRDPKIRLCYPERMASGVYRIYESMNLRIARRYDYLDKVRIFVDRAIERHAAYALWFHPSDPTEWFDPQLRAILQYLDGERRSGRLWIATMQELAAYCEAREQLSLQVKRQADGVTVLFQERSGADRYGAVDLTLVVPVPSIPSAAWLEMANGTSVPARVSPGPRWPTRVVVDVPAGTRALHLGHRQARTSTPGP